MTRRMNFLHRMDSVQWKWAIVSFVGIDIGIKSVAIRTQYLSTENRSKGDETSNDINISWNFQWLFSVWVDSVPILTRDWKEVNRFIEEIMVKLAVSVFLLVAVAFVACEGIPEIFKKPTTTDKKNCICRLKGCLDDSCEIMHCICQRVSLGSFSIFSRIFMSEFIRNLIFTLFFFSDKYRKTFET